MSGIGLLLMGISVFVLIFVRNDIEAVLDGLVAGAGWAATGPVSIAWMLDRTGTNQQGLASATYFAAQDVGRILGSLALGYLALSFGSMIPFTAGGLLTIAVALILLFLALLWHAKKMNGF